MVDELVVRRVEKKDEELAEKKVVCSVVWLADSKVVWKVEK